MPTFEFRAKRFFFTYSRCPLEKEVIQKFLCEKFQAKLLNVEKWLVCREKHQDGGYHLHAYIQIAETFRSKVDSRWLDCEGYHPEVEMARSYKACVNYIIKDKDYIANFDVKVPNISKKEIGKQLLAGVELTSLVQENPELLLGYKRIKEDLSIYNQDRAKPAPINNPCGVWISGKSGVGKSTIATTKFGNYYFKDKSKWWDGYNGEPTIIAEDVDASWRDIIPFFKIWADKYPFRGEVKGSTIYIRPVKFVVTSNKTIEELFELVKWDKDDYLPYTRRFNSYYITSIEDYEEQL